MIKAENLSKSYRKKKAVDDLSLTIELGKVTGFLGPNGSGKSTTMRLMLGLDQGNGTTTFDGKKLSDHENLSSVVGILLEAKAFHPTRRAADHLKVLATAGGIDESRVYEALEIVGLSDVAKKSPGKFSLGMSQRLGIAAAILGKPKYLLLDEPANGLDPEGIAWLRKFIKDYADEGNAVFVSSHLLSEMAQMADDVIVIGRGKLIAQTSVDDLINNKSHSSTFIRSSKPKELGEMLKKAKCDFVKKDNGFSVSGVTPEELGALAFKNQIPVAEIYETKVSLEEAFLELTSGSQEYQTKSDKKDSAK